MAQALALEESVEHNGKVWKLSPITMEIMGYWEQWLEDRAWQKLYARRDKMTPVDFAEERKELRESIIAGDLSFWSMPSLRAQGRLGGPGYKAMISLRLKALNNPDEITDKFLDELIDEKAEEIQDKLSKMDAPDPNLSTPAATPGADSESKASSPGSPASLSA